MIQIWDGKHAGVVGTRGRVGMGGWDAGVVNHRVQELGERAKVAGSN